MNYAVYEDRREAGRRLAERLRAFRNEDVVVVGVAPVGVEVAHEVAIGLNAPLDAVVVRKIQIPWMPELAVGAIASGGSLVIDEERAAEEQLSQSEVESLVHGELSALLDTERRYRRVHTPESLRGRTVILVDEGICAGWRMQAAIGAVADSRPARVIVATPVASDRACRQMRSLVDEFICPISVECFTSASQFYGTSPPMSDDEVMELLASRKNAVQRRRTEEQETMLVEINITPIGSGEHLADSVSTVIELIAESGLDYQVTAMGTLVEGAPDRIWPLVRQCHELARRDHSRVVTEVRIDDRKLPERELHRDVRRVEQILGRPLNRTA